MTEAKKDNWGGAREGAGRPATGLVRTSIIYIRVTPDEKALCVKMADGAKLEAWARKKLLKVECHD